MGKWSCYNSSSYMRLKLRWAQRITFKISMRRRQNEIKADIRQDQRSEQIGRLEEDVQQKEGTLNPKPASHGSRCKLGVHAMC